MKAKLPREILLLTLPVLLIGGAVLLRVTGHLGPAESSDSGPLRLEVSPFQAVDLSPFDVSEGYSWNALIDFPRKVGHPEVPRSWAFQNDVNSGDTSQLHIDYRRGRHWKTALPSPKGRYLVSLGYDLGRRSSMVQANLSTVPRDASEIRLRGKFAQWASYRGVVPPGWKLPPGTKNYGLFHEIPVESKPIDISIKAADEPFPAPEVSREEMIELKDTLSIKQNEQGRAGVMHTQDVFYMHLHHRQKKNWGTEMSLRLQNLHVYDANGKKIDLFWDYGAGQAVGDGYGTYSGTWNQLLFSPDKPSDDLISGVFASELAPKKTWSSYKQPLRVELDASDGVCWPTHVKAFFQAGQGTYKDMIKFGAP